jgi:glycosyltransferase involved in cell wall biosynthesis
VTVIIPTYNWSTALPYSIGSVRRQRFTDWELLVVGDGCTDDSGAVVAGIGDPRVRWINLPLNTGHQSGPNNEGLRQARGELLAFLGHDDLWLPHHLSLLVAAIEAGAGLAYGITEMVGVEPDDVEAVPRGLGAYRPGLWIPPSGLVVRRSALAGAGGWPHPREVSVDPETALWRRLAESGVPLAFVPRLTAVKFPAARRRDAYRRRPSHEQAAWFARIGAEPDFEAAELARMLALTVSPRVVLRRQLSRVTARLAAPSATGAASSTPTDGSRGSAPCGERAARAGGAPGSYLTAPAVRPET